MSDLYELIAKLNVADETERAYAAEDIGYLNLANGVAPLLGRIQVEPSLLVRDAILQALVRIESDEAIQGAVSLLMSDDPQIRNLAVYLLRRRLDQAIPFLQEVMKDGDSDMRKFVLDVLQGLPANGAESIYEAALADRDINVVITAVENVGGVRAKALRQTVEDLLLKAEHPMLDAACLSTLAEIGNESSLKAVKKRFARADLVPNFLLTPYLKAIEALGGEQEFSEIAELMADLGTNVRPRMVKTLLALAEAHKLTGPAVEALAGQAKELAQ
jgi:HEAT repeat protein